MIDFVEWFIIFKFKEGCTKHMSGLLHCTYVVNEASFIVHDIGLIRICVL